MQAVYHFAYHYFVMVLLVLFVCGISVYFYKKKKKKKKKKRRPSGKTVDAAGRFMVKGRDVLNQKCFPFFFLTLSRL